MAKTLYERMFDIPSKMLSNISNIAVGYIAALLDHYGTLRMCEIQKHLSSRLSKRVVMNNVTVMTKDGLLNRVPYAEVPSRVEYSLTELGRDILPIIEATIRPIEKYLQKAEQTETKK